MLIVDYTLLIVLNHQRELHVKYQEWQKKDIKCCYLAKEKDRKQLKRAQEITMTEKNRGNESQKAG